MKLSPFKYLLFYHGGISVGDEVRITRKPEFKEKGFPIKWVPGMDRFIGRKGKVKRDNGKEGYMIEIDNDVIIAPRFILEKL